VLWGFVDLTETQALIIPLMLRLSPAMTLLQAHEDSVFVVNPYSVFLTWAISATYPRKHYRRSVIQKEHINKVVVQDQRAKDNCLNA